ncbi:MAG: TolC family protein [Ignavibacteria bacterium]|nr:TolC family protein [Ignavibacteria bacterium]
MNRQGFLVRCFIAVLAWFPISSDAGGQPLRLTIKDAVLQTLENNPDLMMVRMEVERADALVKEAWGNALPSVDLDASYTRALKKPVFFLPGDFFGEEGGVRAIEVGSTNALAAGITANQILFNSAVFVGVGAAGTYSRLSEEQYRSARIDFITRSRRAFYDVLLARRILDLAVETRDNTAENLRTVRLLADQGLVSEFDLLRAEVTLENVIPEVINAENALKQAENVLKNIMSIPYDTEIDVVGDLEYLPVADSLLVTAQEQMLRQNPQLSALQYQTEFSDAVVSAQKSEYLPTLYAFGNYTYQAQSNQFNALTDDVIASSQVGLSLSLNVFNGLQSTARVEQAQIEHLKSLEQLSGTRQNLLSATEAVLLQLNKARRRIEAQGRTIDQAQRGYEIATTRYSSGLGTQLEVNDAQLALVRANVNKIEAVYEYAAASAELDRLLGRVPDYVKDEDQ